MAQWNKYTIMHKDRKVACIHKSGKCVIYNHALMPYNLYLEESTADDTDERINNLENFYYWCSARMLTLDRKYAKEILNALNKKQAVTDRDRAEIAISYHCLSLTDVYWVKNFRENVSFDDINLFDNSLAGAFVDVCLHGKAMTVQNSKLLTQEDVAGDLMTAGVAPKAWTRRNGTFFLMKDGEERDVEAELLADRIIDCFKVDHVKYTEEYYDGKKVSVSKIISSLDVSLVPAEYVEIYAANHGMKLLDIVYEKSFYDYHMMNIIDYLIGNNDRHWSNWGFYADNKNNKLLGLYPLMDFNKAFSDYKGINGGICQTAGERTSQKDAALEGVKAVGLNQIKEVKREWFADSERYDTFCQRLKCLTEYAHNA